MRANNIVSKKLLYIPFFMVVIISILMEVGTIIIAKSHFDITFFAFMLGISLFNVFPFFILHLIQSKVHFAFLSGNSSFYAAFIMGVLLISIVAVDSLFSFFLGKPGIQFIPLEFLFLPVYTFLLMIITYFIWIILKLILLNLKNSISKLNLRS